MVGGGELSVDEKVVDGETEPEVDGLLESEADGAPAFEVEGAESDFEFVTELGAGEFGDVGGACGAGAAASGTGAGGGGVENVFTLLL